VVAREYSVVILSLHATELVVPRNLELQIIDIAGLEVVVRVKAQLAVRRYVAQQDRNSRANRLQRRDWKPFIVGRKHKQRCIFQESAHDVVAQNPGKDAHLTCLLEETECIRVSVICIADDPKFSVQMGRLVGFQQVVKSLFWNKSTYRYYVLASIKAIPCEEVAAAGRRVRLGSVDVVSSVWNEMDLGSCARKAPLQLRREALGNRYYSVAECDGAQLSNLQHEPREAVPFAVLVIFRMIGDDDLHAERFGDRGHQGRADALQMEQFR